MVRARTRERLREIQEVLEVLTRPERLAELLVARLVAVGADPLLVEEARLLLRHVREAVSAAVT